MEQILQKTLRDNEKVLWFGRPTKTKLLRSPDRVSQYVAWIITAVMTLFSFGVFLPFAIADNKSIGIFLIGLVPMIGIPLAAGVWIPLFGWQLNPMFGAAAMSLSSVCVVSNALRLNWFKMYDAGRDKKMKSKKKEEETTMTKTMKIEGMMCGHCEARVKKVLEALPEVDAAEVSHEAGTAVVTLNAEVSDDVLKKTVEDQDYKVLDIR